MDVVVAAFDVDGTLTVRDCVVPFMRRVAGTARFVAICVRSSVTILSLVKNRDRDAIKRLFVQQVFAGVSVEQTEAIGVEFAANVADGWLRSDVAERLRWHQREGHVVVFVSASLNPYLEPLGDLCEVDAVLCTTLEESDGAYTGNLVGNNCRAAEKVARLRGWMTEAGIDHGALRYAYGDSVGDAEMLATAEQPFNVKSTELEGVPV